MALPDYSNQYGSGSMFAQNQGNNRNSGPGGGRDAKKKPKYPKQNNLNQYFNPDPNAISGLDSITPLGSYRNAFPPDQQPSQGPSQPANPSDFTFPDIPLNQGPFTFGAQDLNNPFYDPSATYIPQGYRGATPPMMPSAGSPNPLTMGNQYAEENPEAYYYALMNQQGFGGLDARSRAAQSMYSDYARVYQSAKMNNPELMWAQYAGQQNTQNLVGLLSEEQLGIDRGQQRGSLNWTLRG